MRLVLDHISKQIKSNVILDNLSLKVNESNMVAIVGENGVGKTTLLKIAVGDWKPDTGKVTINGKIGYCPQEARLFPLLSVKENFEYFGAAYNMSKKEILHKLDGLTTYFNYTDYQNRKVEQLSGGTKQKLNLSIALMNTPDILILDEPYSGFDIETYTLFLDRVNDLKSSGCSILMVTHLITDTNAYNKIYNLRNGTLE
ncbi:MAG: ABC transporter ATP-binding protein [Bacteroidota bacterium]